MKAKPIAFFARWRMAKGMKRKLDEDWRPQDVCPIMSAENRKLVGCAAQRLGQPLGGGKRK